MLTAWLLGGRLLSNCHLCFLSSLFYIPTTVLPPTPSTIFLYSAICLLSAALAHLICHLPSIFLTVFYSNSNYYQINVLSHVYCTVIIYIFISLSIVYIVWHLFIYYHLFYHLLNGTSYAKQWVLKTYKSNMKKTEQFIFRDMYAYAHTYIHACNKNYCKNTIHLKESREGYVGV